MSAEYACKGEGCDFKADVVYDAACHSYGREQEHPTFVRVMLELELGEQ